MLKKWGRLSEKQAACPSKEPAWLMEFRAQSGEFFWLNRLLSYFFSDQPVFWSILSAKHSENGEYFLISP